jgi:hypothetical protein
MVGTQVSCGLRQAPSRRITIPALPKKRLQDVNRDARQIQLVSSAGTFGRAVA